MYQDGTPGHRAHNVYPLHWGGDSSSNFENLGPQIAGGLSFGLSGFQFWSQDIGGFLGQPDGPLLVRWMQAAMFFSHTRIHGFGVRELDRFGQPVRDLCREALRLRYRLMPYLHGAAIDCVTRSLPMARAMVVEFQDDPSTWRIYDQWLLGDSLLVAPILDERGERRIYLPAGTWADWWTREAVTGPRWLTVRAPLDRVPLYLREGGIIPLGSVTSHVDERPTEELVLRIARYTRDGHTRFVAPVNGEEIALHYEATQGLHRLVHSPTRVRLVVDALGADGAPIELIEAAP